MQTSSSTFRDSQPALELGSNYVSSSTPKFIHNMVPGASPPSNFSRTESLSHFTAAPLGPSGSGIGYNGPGSASLARRVNSSTRAPMFSHRGVPQTQMANQPMSMITQGNVRSRPPNFFSQQS